LKAHARQFVEDKHWPANFTLVLDPDYAVINAYGLRWDASKETAYPATLVIDKGGTVRFAHVSQTHGNRLSATRALAELPSL
jgi:thioredoxin-dependent peroxiredoxin